LNIKSSINIIINTTQPRYLYELVSIYHPHGHNTRSYLTSLIKPSSSFSHSSLLPTCFNSSLEPASYIAQNYSSPSDLHLNITV